MESTIGTIIALLLLVLTAWLGYKKYKKLVLWLILFPVFSIVHTILGWHILELAFQYDAMPELFPLYASILSASYAGVMLFGFPLEAVGFSDEFAYTIAFGLNAILVSVLSVLIIQWFQKKRASKNA